MASNTVSFDLELAVKDFNTSLKQVGSNLNSFHDDFKTQSSNSSKAWGSFIGNIGANAFSFAAQGVSNLIGSMKDLGIESFNAAVNAQETASKFEAVFSDIGESSDKVAKDLQKNFGLGVTESKTLLSATGDLLTGFGFAQEGALELSKEVQELAVDLASFTNFSGGAAGASEAITKALLGETESMKSLGVSIQQTAVQQQVAINKSKGLTFESERQAKAQATLDLIIQQSGNAIGDYANTSTGAANTLKLLSTRIEDLKIAIGNKLIPVVTPLINQMITWIEKNEDFLSQKVEEGVGKLTEAFFYLKENMDKILPIAENVLKSILALAGVAIVANGVTAVTTAINALKLSLVFLGGPITATIAAVAALGGAVAWAMSQGQNKEAIRSVEELARATENLADLKERLAEAQEMGISERNIESIQAMIEKEEEHIESLKAQGEVKNQLATDEVKQIEKVELAKDIAAKNKAKVDKREKKDNDKKLKDKIKADREQATRDLKASEESIKLNRRTSSIITKTKQDQYDAIKSFAQNSASDLINILGVSGKEGLVLSKAIALSFIAIEDSKARAAAQVLALSTGPAYAATLATLNSSISLTTGLSVAAVGLSLASGLKDIDKATSEQEKRDIANANIERSRQLEQEREDRIASGNANAGDIAFAIEEARRQRFEDDNTTNFNDSVRAIVESGQSATAITGGNNITLSDLKEAISGLEIVLQADDTEIARSVSRGVQDGIVIGRS